MKKYLNFILILILIPSFSFASDSISKMSEEYVNEWISFYPSSAYASGRKKSASKFENYSSKRVSMWINFNQKILNRLKKLPKYNSLDESIDKNLIERKVKSELYKWKKDKAHLNSPLTYAGLISQALTHILVREDLEKSNKLEAVKARLEGIIRLCKNGIKQLKDGKPSDTGKSLFILKKTKKFYLNNLPDIISKWSNKDKEVIGRLCKKTAYNIEKLIIHIKKLKNILSLTDFMKNRDYAEKLIIYTGLDITPEKLEKISEREIKRVRKLIAKIAHNYVLKNYPDIDFNNETDEIIRKAINDMESDRVNNQQDFLKQFKNLIDRAEYFVRKKNIATIPGKRTLQTHLSPQHFAGASVGGVYSSGPFNPEADTLFYLPTIPDDSPEKVKKGFYRSFNTHFNIIIVPHEIYPGHYMQLKISSTHPRIVRSLFGDGLYIEGWATFCEEVALNRGWNGNKLLDRLAHLRKRLENAVRAYVSVKVHYRHWDKEKVKQFAIERGLLSPQFAVNLWDRVLSSPLQLTSYFLGFIKFKEILKNEKNRLGNNFKMKYFSDRILKAGAVPINMIDDIFRKEE